MKVILDDREHALYEKCRSILDSNAKPSHVQLSSATLVLGDILITTDEDKPVLLIERKTFADLLASIKDGRYEEQSYRLIHASDFPSHSIYYLLEGMFSQLKNPAEKSIILSATTSLSFFKGFSIYRTATIQETAEWVLHMADKIEREFGKGKIPYYLYHRTFEQETQQNSSLSNEQIEREENTGEGKENKEEKDELPPPPKAAPYCSVVKKVKKENITPENIGEIVLCQIPGISSATASVVMNKFKGKLPDLLDALRKDSTCLENLTMESGRKINKSTADNIQKYLC